VSDEFRRKFRAGVAGAGERNNSIQVTFYLCMNIQDVIDKCIFSVGVGIADITPSIAEVGFMGYGNPGQSVKKKKQGKKKKKKKKSFHFSIFFNKGNGSSFSTSRPSVRCARHEYKCFVCLCEHWRRNDFPRNKSARIISLGIGAGAARVRL
jgi:hypothetical protein